jgi:hypothetical protein
LEGWGRRSPNIDLAVALGKGGGEGGDEGGRNTGVGERDPTTTVEKRPSATDADIDLQLLLGIGRNRPEATTPVAIVFSHRWVQI